MILKFRSTTLLLIIAVFVLTSVRGPVYAQSIESVQERNGQFSSFYGDRPFLSAPGEVVHLSNDFKPAFLKGIVIHPENPLRFDFIVYKGDAPLTGEQKRGEYTKLAKYFLASLAIPDEDQWVNLSPYEKGRIIKDDFGKTEMGRDLLAQDYMLKEITASLIYPESHLGKTFWEKVYGASQKAYGTTNAAINTFNKVWILPDDALVYEKGNSAYVIKNHLKVMLEEDYLALKKHAGQPGDRSLALSPSTLPNKDTSTLGSQIVREIVLPALEKEVNTGKNFAALRQVYSGMLLAAWYKRTLKESLLNKIYSDKAKVKGVDYRNSFSRKGSDIEFIYRRYLKAYAKGVFNFIKEDVDRYTHETIPRKYFSGGAVSYPHYAEVVHTTGTMPSPAMLSLEKDAAMNSLDFVQVAAEEPRVAARLVVFQQEQTANAAMKTLESGPKDVEIATSIFTQLLRNMSGRFLSTSGRFPELQLWKMPFSSHDRQLYLSLGVKDSPISFSEQLSVLKRIAQGVMLGQERLDLAVADYGHGPNQDIGLRPSKGYSDRETFERAVIKALQKVIDNGDSKNSVGILYSEVNRMPVSLEYIPGKGYYLALTSLTTKQRIYSHLADNYAESIIKFYKWLARPETRRTRKFKPPSPGAPPANALISTQGASFEAARMILAAEVLAGIKGRRLPNFISEKWNPKYLDLRAYNPDITPDQLSVIVHNIAQEGVELNGSIVFLAEMKDKNNRSVGLMFASDLPYHNKDFEYQKLLEAVVKKLMEYVNYSTGPVIIKQAESHRILTLLQYKSNSGYRIGLARVINGVSLEPEYTRYIPLERTGFAFRMFNYARRAIARGEVLSTVLGLIQIGVMEEVVADPAMIPKGGIDFNAAHLNLQIKRDGRGVPLSLSRQDTNNIHIDGLIPVVISIKSAAEIPLLSKLQLI